MALQQETVNYREGYDIGIGVAMATGSPMALGARGEVTPPFAPGDSGAFTFRRISTTNELETELGISAEASGGVGLFSASASFAFTKRCAVQSSSLIVYVSAQLRSSFKQIDEPKLSKSAAAMKKNGETDRFASTFGEYFVRGMRTGGRFVGVIRIETKNTQAKTTVDVALDGNYGKVFDAEAQVHLKNTLKTAEARVEAFVFFEGGEVKTIPRSNDPVELLDQLYRAMDEWRTTIGANPAPYAVTLAPYAIALGAEPPNKAEIEHQRDVLIRCANLRAQTMDKLNLVDYILDPTHTEEFEINADSPDLAALQSAFTRDLDVIADTASFAINELKNACFPEQFMAKKHGEPNFRFTQLPSNMPRQRAVAPPRLVRLPLWETTEEADAGAVALGIQLNKIGLVGGTSWRILDADPDLGSLVPVGSVVTIWYSQGDDIDFGGFVG